MSSKFEQAASYNIKLMFLIVVLILGLAIIFKSWYALSGLTLLLGMCTYSEKEKDKEC